MPIRRTRCPCSLSNRASVCTKRIAPPSSSMLLATMKTSRGWLLATGGSEEDVVDDLSSGRAGVVLAELGHERPVALVEFGAPRVSRRKRLDQLVTVTHHRTRRLVLQLEVNAALAVGVVAVVIRKKHHRP